MIYRESDWPHGCRCENCHELFTEGDEMSEVLDSMLDDGIPIVNPRCPRCVEKRLLEAAS